MTVETARQAFERIEPILAQLELSEENVPAEGLEFIEAKTETLIGYLTNLSFYMVLKATPGAEIPTSLFEQLFKQRWLLQRARPLDQRMSYSIEKLLKEWKTPDAARAATPGTLRTTVCADASRSDETPTEEQKLYKAPRFQAVEAPTKVTKNDKLEKQVERKRQRFEQGEMMRELREEFVDAPIEVGGSGGAAGSLELEALERKAAHKTRYEEDNFMRLMPTRKDRKENKRLRALKDKSQSAGVASLEDISDISKLVSGGGDKRLDELKNARGALKRQRDAQDEAFFGGNRQSKRKNKK